jgi:hypothetical protein
MLKRYFDEALNIETDHVLGEPDKQVRYERFGYILKIKHPSIVLAASETTKHSEVALCKVTPVIEIYADSACDLLKRDPEKNESLYAPARGMIEESPLHTIDLYA